MTPESKIRVGISHCLLGAPLRFDGGHKLDKGIVQGLGTYFDFVPVCPEFEIGLGVPRESIRLVEAETAPGQPGLRLVGNRSGRDLTEAMREFSQRRVAELRGERLMGFIFKSGSPSCALGGAKVYRENGMPAGRAPGLFAQAVLQGLPGIPLADEAALNEPRQREAFVASVLCRAAWQAVLDAPDLNALQAFHARYKRFLLARSEASLRRMGRLVATAKGLGLPRAIEQYEALLFPTLRVIPSPKRNANVLFVMLAKIKASLNRQQQRCAEKAIEDYRAGRVALVVPQAILRHFASRLGWRDWQDQTSVLPENDRLRLLHAV